MITYRIAGKETAIDQMNIYNIVFGENAKIDRWILKHYQNPATKEQKLYGAFDGDKLVAINGFLEMKYIFGNEEFKVIQSCDTAVDSAYRNRGIFTKIIMSAEEEFRKQGYDVMIGYPNFNSYHGFIKMGWKEITRTNKLFLPANVQNMIKHMKGINLTKASNLAAWVMWHRIRKAARLINDIDINLKDTITGYEYNQYIDKSYIHFYLDDALLKWKLDDLVGIYNVRKGNQDICKFVVCEYDYGDGLKRANIILAAGEKKYIEEYKCALAQVLLKLYKRFDLICIWEPAIPWQKRCLKELGFLNNIVTKEGSPFIAKILTSDEKKLEILENEENWNPMQIETDTMINLSKV